MSLRTHVDNRANDSLSIRVFPAAVYHHREKANVSKGGNHPLKLPERATHVPLCLGAWLSPADARPMSKVSGDHQSRVQNLASEFLYPASSCVQQYGTWQLVHFLPIFAPRTEALIFFFEPW
jgi:hypothetical protein